MVDSIAIAVMTTSIVCASGLLKVIPSMSKCSAFYSSLPIGGRPSVTTDRIMLHAND